MHPFAPRPIVIRGTPLAAGRLPAVCAPLVARTRAALEREAADVAAKQPDLLEWRVDFFEGIADASQVIATANAIRTQAAGIPVLFTRRAQWEGGQPLALAEPRVVALYEAVCEAACVEMVDFEMGNDAAHLAAVRSAAQCAGLPLVLSFHDFDKTPSTEELEARFARAQDLGADVAKIAVMPHDPQDVLRLLEATLDASRTLRIPVISMAMGGLGALSRVVGGQFGSALTFAVGQSASAPGQIAIDDLRRAMGVLPAPAASAG